MSISDLASLGEFVSSIAVLISLIYLAVQIRQATVQFQRNEDNATQVQTSAFRLANISDRDVAKLFLDGLQDPDGLDAIDQFRHSLLLHEFMGLSYQHWERLRLKISRAPLPAARIKMVLSSAGGSRWWKQNRGAYVPEFRDSVESL